MLSLTKNPILSQLAAPRRTLATTRNPILYPSGGQYRESVHGRPPTMPDIAHAYRPTRRHAEHLDVIRAIDHIGILPGSGESTDLILSGRYRPFSIIPATIGLTGQPIDELHLATLSFSKDNAADLLGLIDAGQVRRATLLVSHYFSQTSAKLFDPLADALKTRGHRVFTYRSHVKLIAMRMRSGAAYVVTGSGNLRSCKCLESAVITHDEDLYLFHVGWIDALFAAETTGDTSNGN